MTLLANIRINVGAPFPSKIKGSGPVTIAKQNGIWAIGFQVANLGTLPVGVDPTKVEVMVWNVVAQTFQQTTLAGLQSGGLLATIVTSAQSPYVPLPTDFFLLVDTTGGPVEIDLPLEVSRGGVALSVKDYKGNAAVNNITIKPQGAPANETIDSYTNAAPLVLKANYDGVKLLPITGGYIITP